MHALIIVVVEAHESEEVDQEKGQGPLQVGEVGLGGAVDYVGGHEGYSSSNDSGSGPFKSGDDSLLFGSKAGLVFLHEG